MLKRINWYKILFISIWVISLASLLLLMGFVHKKDRETLCKEVKIWITGHQFFIEQQEVHAIMFQGNPVIGKKLATINLHRIEKRLTSNPYIQYAQVYADLDGVIYVNIKQREPILRIFNGINQDFYIDQNGYKMPVSINYTAPVLVANGHIEETFNYKIDTLKTPIAKNLYQIAKFVQQNNFWNQQIEQIFVRENGDIELTPRVGEHQIILGTADSLAIKFNQLMAFYKQILPKKGWSTYKNINLKYARQIVCEHKGIIKEVDSNSIAKIENSLQFSNTTR